MSISRKDHKGNSSRNHASGNTADKARAYQRARIKHWDGVAEWKSGLPLFRHHYHRLIEHQFQQMIPPDSRVLELGCGSGGLLVALAPRVGVGVDFSRAMLRKAKARYPNLRFMLADAHHLPLEGQFDYIILSDLVNDLWDVQAVFEQITRIADSRTRVLINTYSRLWQLPLGLGRLLGMKTPNLEQNWLTVEDLRNLLHLANCEIIKTDVAVLLPLNIWPLSQILNRVLARLWPFRWFALSNIVVARTLPRDRKKAAAEPVVSIIVPARNEEGNIASIFERVPKLGRATEIIFVEGHSKDGTYERIAAEIAARKRSNATLLKQSGLGKADAVWEGFGAAKGEVLMILDADLSVPPEDLARFYDALVAGKGEFINGVRLVYPMENRAMRTLNVAGNKFFSLAFSYLLGQPIKDTLCGTKVLWKDEYELIRKHWGEFGKRDPFGDFDLLFGAAKLGLKIVDMPVRYRERVYGSTNIDRWRHGLMLLRMLGLAARRLKFV